MIDKLNNMIEECIYHGGDSGGPYFTDLDKQKEAVQQVADMLNLDIEAVRSEFSFKTLYYHFASKKGG